MIPLHTITHSKMCFRTRDHGYMYTQHFSQFPTLQTTLVLGPSNFDRHFLFSARAGEEIRALQKSLVDYSYQMSQLHQQLGTADRQRSSMQAKMLSSERMNQQVIHTVCVMYIQYHSGVYMYQELSLLLRPSS